MLFGVLSAHTLSAAEGGLSKEFADSDFVIVVPGKIDSFNRTDVESSAFVDLLDKMTGDQMDQNISIDPATLDSFVTSINSTDAGLQVQFDRLKVLKFFQDRQIGVVTGAVPDVLMWIAYPDEQGNKAVLADEDTNGFIAAVKDRSAFYGQSVYFPIMDSDDLVAVSVSAVENQDTFAISKASARYGAKYIVVGNVTSPDEQELNFTWQLYDVSAAGVPVAQSEIHGASFDIGRILSRNLYTHFAKDHLEKVHGIQGPHAPASGRVAMTGSGDGNTKSYVVFAGYMSYSDVINFERTLSSISGIKRVSLYQTQADQTAYEIDHTVPYTAISEAIKKIPGVSLPNSAKPYNYTYDEIAGKGSEPFAEKVNDVQTSGDSKTVTDTPEGTTTETPEKKESSSEKTPSSVAPETGVNPNEVIAIPINDPSSIKDTSDEKL